MNAGSRFTIRSRQWHGVRSMYKLRGLRRSVDLGQREFAALLDVPLETLRTWDRDGERCRFTRCSVPPRR
jgi:DNA-binding transcriptional regulator YiaG